MARLPPFPPQQLYYGNSQPGPFFTPPDHSYPVPDVVYDHYRSGPLPNGTDDGSGTLDWQSPTEYNAVAGSSRSMDPYQPYSQNPTQTPNNSRPPPADGWSSLHPGAYPTTRSAGVKLEDLVTGDSRAGVNLGPGGMTSLPLNTSTSMDRPLGVGEPGGQGPSEFIKKLYKMLEEESVAYGRGRLPGQPRGGGSKRGAVGWGRNETSFVVWEMNDFTTKILPQTFRHSNFSSFVRQLNKYGFSKIKHVDEETGQLKENVWEFQHPHFQAGGKADLESIKRKAVIPKKGAVDDRELSPARGGGMAEITDLEQRVLVLEERLAKSEDEASKARTRELALMGLMREVVGHLGSVERDCFASPGPDDTPAAEMLRLYNLCNQVSATGFMTFPPLTQPRTSRQFRSYNGQAKTTSWSQATPRTEKSGSGSGRSMAGPSPDAAKEDVIEVDGQSASQLPFPSIPLGAPSNVFVDPMNWFPDSATGGFGDAAARRQSQSDGSTLRMVVQAMNQRNSSGSGSGSGSGEAPDPLDTTPSKTQASLPAQIQQSPFGTLIIPAHMENSPGDGIRLRRSTVIKPSWTHAPKILVVEDDVVYRQLSSKFLEKFGCQIETVEDASGAVEKMNSTKYDLVLMDIFFGPNMDGRKATSLIRKFDMYTPIISMTSNAQPKDVDSYLQSGMTDVLAKPFTKHGLFGILDKHLIHLKAIQQMAEVPRFFGVPPLSDQGVVDAVALGAAQWNMGMLEHNPLAAMGWSDETYQLVCQQFIATGSMSLPDGAGVGAGAIAPNVVFGDTPGLSRKRSDDGAEEDWEPEVEPANKKVKTERR
ncbi:osomolarity two-component system, response regulator SKN7, partial [Tremellales sp. Uapishka_1]